MTISSKNWIVRWAFILENIPKRVSICKLFWRCILKASGITLAGLLLAFLIVESIVNLFGVLTGLVTVVCVIVAFAGMVGLLIAFETAGERYARIVTEVEYAQEHGFEPCLTPFQLFIYSTKKKICPFIEIN
jgi:hypothetical protein